MQESETRTHPHPRSGPSRPLWEVVRDQIRDFLFRHPDWTMEKLSEELEVHPSTLYAYTEPPREQNGSGRAIPTPRLIRLGQLTNDDRPARYILDRFQELGLLADVHVGEQGPPSFEGATVEGEDLSGRDLRGLKAKGATFVHVNFSSAVLNEADLAGATLIDCNLFRARMLGVRMPGITALDSDFSEAYLTAADARKANIVRCVFRDCHHSALDMRDARFLETKWFADRYRGGLSLRGADISGLKGISESHGVVKQIVLDIADGRPRFQGFAGYIELKITGCWQAALSYLETEFSESERQELLDAFRSNPAWLIGVRLEYEVQKRDWLAQEFGEAFPSWPDMKTRNAAIKGRRCTVAGIRGHVSSAGLFVPDGIDQQDRFDTFNVTTDEMLALAMAQRK